MIKIGRDMRVRASQANAAIGIIKLGGTENNPTVAEVYDPIISAVMVSDEIERPDIVKIGDTYYLFASSRLNRGTNNAAWRKANDKVGDNVVMLGWYSRYSRYCRNRPNCPNCAYCANKFGSDWSNSGY